LAMTGYPVVIVPVVVAVFLFGKDGNAAGVEPRWELWRAIINDDTMITINKRLVYPYKKAWKLGCGLGHWKVIGKQLYNAGQNPTPGLGWSRLHMTWLNGLVEMGAGFGVFLVGYTINLIRRYAKQALIPFTAVIVIIVCGSTNSMFRINAVNAMIAITWLSILEVQLLNKGAT